MNLFGMQPAASLAERLDFVLNIDSEPYRG